MKIIVTKHSNSMLILISNIRSCDFVVIFPSAKYMNVIMNHTVKGVSVNENVGNVNGVFHCNHMIF